MGTYKLTVGSETSGTAFSYAMVAAGMVIDMNVTGQEGRFHRLFQLKGNANGKSNTKELKLYNGTYILSFKRGQQVLVAGLVTDGDVDKLTGTAGLPLGFKSKADLSPGFFGTSVPLSNFTFQIENGNNEVM